MDNRTLNNVSNMLQEQLDTAIADLQGRIDAHQSRLAYLKTARESQKMEHEAFKTGLIQLIDNHYRSFDEILCDLESMEAKEIAILNSQLQIKTQE